MKTASLMGAVALAMAVPAFAGATMTAGEFLSRAEPLLKKNKASLLFSGEARKLMRVVGDSARRNRERFEADRSAGRKPAMCLPAKGKAAVGADDLIAHLRSIPAAQRGQSFDQAFSAMMAKKYPCRS